MPCENLKTLVRKISESAVEVSRRSALTPLQLAPPDESANHLKKTTVKQDGIVTELRLELREPILAGLCNLVRTEPEFSG